MPDVQSIYSRDIQLYMDLAQENVENTSDDVFMREEISGRWTNIQHFEGPGRPVQRRPGETFSPANFRESFGMHVVINDFGSMFAIPNEDIADDPHGILNTVLPGSSGMLSEAYGLNEELISAELIMNNGYTASTGLTSMYDGVSFFNTAHLMSRANSGTTWSNRPTVDGDISIGNIDAGIVNMRLQLAANGLTRINAKPTKIVYNPTMQRVVQQVLNGDKEPYTFDNQTNYIKGFQIQLIPWVYWTKSGATGTNNSWFLLGAKHGFRKYVRAKVAIKDFQDDYTNSTVFRLTHRFAVANIESRWSYGSLGS